MLNNSEVTIIPDGRRIFLSAEWRYLAMLNYEVDGGVLAPYVPNGTELDSWNGKIYLSLVGFRFLNTRVWGMAIPFHRNFDEVNLRFYVRRSEGEEVRHGVVFIREFVPKTLIALVARALYNEQYTALPMMHNIEIALNPTPFITAEYQCRAERRWHGFVARASGPPAEAERDSLAHFISEHNWGYAKQRDGGASEYYVGHPPWRIWHNASAAFEGDAQALYGPRFATLLPRAPDFSLIAEGSQVQVSAGRRIA